MNLTDIYGLGHQARGPKTYLALGGAFLTIYFCVTLKADLLVYALGALYLAFVLRRLILNPGAGFRLWPDRIDIFTAKGLVRASLEDIEKVAIGSASDGRTICAVRLSDGRNFPLEGVGRMDPLKLIREFGRRGVPIQS
ncbi:MAG: hypothetical protein KDE03_11590 [Rhodobacteraceae bacterium]|nr:hypothetical protein [Paracoccaceae bacterium]